MNYLSQILLKQFTLTLLLDLEILPEEHRKRRLAFGFAQQIKPKLKLVWKFNFSLFSDTGKLKLKIMQKWKISQNVKEKTPEIKRKFLFLLCLKKWNFFNWSNFHLLKSYKKWMTLRPTDFYSVHPDDSWKSRIRIFLIKLWFFIFYCCFC